MTVSSTHNGWRYDPANTRLDFYYRGTRAGHINASGISITGTLAVTGAGTITGLLTASAALTVTTGDLTVTAGDAHVVAENLYMGAETAFATTEPTSAIIFKVGTAPVGTITTSAGIFTDGTDMKKIVAGGTVSNIET